MVVRERETQTAVHASDVDYRVDQDALNNRARTEVKVRLRVAWSVREERMFSGGHFNITVFIAII